MRRQSVNGERRSNAIVNAKVPRNRPHSQGGTPRCLRRRTHSPFLHRTTPTARPLTHRPPITTDSTRSTSMPRKSMMQSLLPLSTTVLRLFPTQQPTPLAPRRRPRIILRCRADVMYPWGRICLGTGAPGRWLVVAHRVPRVTLFCMACLLLLLSFGSSHARQLGLIMIPTENTSQFQSMGIIHHTPVCKGILQSHILLTLLVA